MGGPSSAALPDPNVMRSMGQGAPAQGTGCILPVDGYTRFRNGRVEEVDAYQRSDPHCRSRSGIVLVARGRPGPSDDACGKPPLRGPPTGGGGFGRGTGTPPRGGPSQPQSNQPPVTPNARPPAAPATSPEALTEILAPGGVPVGTVYGGSRPYIRTLPGGDAAARNWFERLTANRSGTEITPPGHRGRVIRLPDESVIGYRPPSGGHAAAVDIRINGFPLVKKLHFTD
jgi:hypothetical protein